MANPPPGRVVGAQMQQYYLRRNLMVISIPRIPATGERGGPKREPVERRIEEEGDKECWISD